MRCGDEVERIASGIVGIGVAWRAENPELSVCRSSGWCQGRRIGGQTQVSEDPGDDGRIGDEGEDDHGCGTAGALQSIDKEDSAEELGPGQARSARGHFWMRRPGGAAVGRRGSCGVRGLRRGLRLERRRGQEVSGAGAVAEATMIPNRMSVGRGDERGQAAEELERLEHETSRALRMRPGTAQAIEDAAILTQGESVLGEGGPETVAAQTFKSLAVLSRHGLSGVQRESGHTGAKGLGWRLGDLSGKAELITRHGGLDRRGQGLLEGGGGRFEQRVGLEDVVAETLDDGGQTAGDLQGEGRDLLVGGSGQGHEGEEAVGSRHEESIGHEAVNVGVEVQRSTEALDESDGPGLPGADAEGAAAAALPGEQGAQEGVEQGGEEPAIDGQAEAQGPGECQHPLAVVGFGQELIDQKGGGVGHASPDAARAEPALAGGSRQFGFSEANEGDVKIAIASVTCPNCDARLVIRCRDGAVLDVKGGA